MLSTIYQMDYIPAEKIEYLGREMSKVDLMEFLVQEYETRSENPNELIRKMISTKVPKKFHRKDDEAAPFRRIIDDSHTGLCDRVYLVTCKTPHTLADPDYMRESAYESDSEKREKDARRRNLMLTNKKTMAERNWELEFRYIDDLIKTPKTLDSSDNLDYWFVAKTNPSKCEVIKIDLSGNVPVRYSLTEEYYAPIHHDKEDMTDEAKEWARVLGYEGDVRDYMDWFLETFPTTEERLAFVNGMDAEDSGLTADKQVVICPECGGLTFAAPAMQAYTDPQAKTIPFESVAQMTCEHCGASLVPCFAFNEGELINIENIATIDDIDNEDIDG